MFLPQEERITIKSRQTLTAQFLLGSSRRLGVVYLDLPSKAHTACVLGSGWFHSPNAAILGGHSTRASPKYQRLHCREAVLLQSLIWASFRGSSPAIQCQDSTVLHDPCMLTKPLPPGGLLHMTKFGYQCDVQPWSVQNTASTY